ncbi:MAG: hypothetical protein J6E46_02405 [Faecalicoccus sp.]|nr:hypothetical protein [Faecalicoccus sp.]
MNKSGINLTVHLSRMCNQNRSAGFKLYNKEIGKTQFTMDVDVNRPMLQTKIYEITGIRFRGVIPVCIIADKVFVISTDKVFRRIKDVIDLFYLVHVIPYDKDAVNEILASSGRTLGDFNSF